MGQILIRKIEDGTLERLRQVASARDMPLEAFARDILVEAASRPTLAERIAAIRRLDELRAMSPLQTVDSTSVIRALREGDDSDD